MLTYLFPNKIQFLLKKGRENYRIQPEKISNVIIKAVLQSRYFLPLSPLASESSELGLTSESFFALQVFLVKKSCAKTKSSVVRKLSNHQNLFKKS